MKEYNRVQRLDLDWPLIGLYAALVVLGWLNIFAAVYDPELQQSIFEMSHNAGKQLVWIFGATVIVTVMLLIEVKYYEALAYIFYGVTLLLLVFVMVFARKVQGAQSWIEVGWGMKFQPSEFAKLATAMAVARYLDEPLRKIERMDTLVPVLGIIALPAVLVILQGDTGSALVFAGFALALYREGFAAPVMLLGIALVVLFYATLFLKTYIPWMIGGLGLLALVAVLMIWFFYPLHKWRKIAFIALATGMAAGLMLSVDYIIYQILQPHQRDRIVVLVNPDTDPMGAGWQISQSKIAIGSGGFAGKGFLEGTQTKFDFVPDQSTDFIFCTVGEEHGWIGSILVIGLFLALLYRIMIVAERQKMRFARVYGYCIVSIFFMHFMINIGMTIGLFPVIGIPLPFFSYGGSSLWSFSILLFILIKMDAHRMQMLGRIGG